MVPEPARTRALELISEEVLAHVPGFTAGGTAWATRLPGGTMNASYRVETGAGQFVVRIQNEAAAALGADHEREARLHAAAAEVGLAPVLIHVAGGHAAGGHTASGHTASGHAASGHATGGQRASGHVAGGAATGRGGEHRLAPAASRFMVMEHIAGPTWTAEDMGRPARLRQLAATLHVLHGVRPPRVAPFDIGAAIERLHEPLSAALPAEVAHLSQLLDRSRAALRISDSAQRPRTMIHNDLHHTNLIGARRLYLLDWEYAAVTDPLLDLACLLAYYPQAASHADALLESSRLAGQASPEMLGATTWLCMLVSYFWYRVRRLAGPVSAQDLAAEQQLLARLA
jgi:thiamine kinase-like enzyme